MEILHQYFYRKWKVVMKAVVYSLLSVIFVAFGAFAYIHWEMAFLFTDWHGYVILIVYGLFTIAMILSAVEAFRKLAKLNRGIPAFAVGPDRFIVYDSNGLANPILFEDCDRVRFKRQYHFRGSVITLTLVISYHSKNDSIANENVEIKLSELDQPQDTIDKQLNKIYRQFKKTAIDKD